MSVCFPFFCLIIFAHWLWWNLFGSVTASSDNPSTYLLVKFGASAISGQLLVPQRFFAFFIPLSCRYWGESFNNSFKWDFDQSQHQQSFNNSFGNDASKDDEYSSGDCQGDKKDKQDVKWRSHERVKNMFGRESPFIALRISWSMAFLKGPLNWRLHNFCRVLLLNYGTELIKIDKKVQDKKQNVTFDWHSADAQNRQNLSLAITSYLIDARTYVGPVISTQLNIPDIFKIYSAPLLWS